MLWQADPPESRGAGSRSWGLSRVLLTCPTCRSGLEVPDGTTAMVRCPACKTVFSPAAGVTPPPVVATKEEPRPKRHAKKKPEPQPEPDVNRDFDPSQFEHQPRKKRRHFDDSDDSLSPEERAALRSAFSRAAIGCKFIAGSIALFMLSMMLIIAFWFQAALADPSLAFIMAAGAIAIMSWGLGAVGIGLCLTGPPAPGHWGYGIAAAVAAVLHLVLLAILVGAGSDYSVGREADKDGANARWGLLPTRLDAVMFYPTLIVYKDEEIIPKGRMTFSIVVGVAEILRNVLMMMLVSCLARAAGDEDVAHNCTRAAGFACFGPGALAVALLLFAVSMVETNAQSGDLGKVLITTVRMGTFAVINGAIFPSFMAAREAADACGEPFQNRLPRV